MKLGARPEEAIGFECAWPDRLPAAGAAQPAARRRWGVWLAALIVFAGLAYLGWHLGTEGWPELSAGFAFVT